MAFTVSSEFHTEEGVHWDPPPPPEIASRATTGSIIIGLMEHVAESNNSCP